MTGDVIRFDRSAKAKAGKRAASDIENREEAYLVGRERERAAFEAFLREQAVTKPIWSIYGTGGVGKSTLLDGFRRQAKRHGAVFLLLDSRDFAKTGEAFCRKLQEHMSIRIHENGSSYSPLGHVLEELHRQVRETRVILAIDTCEELGHLEGWLREEFLRRLDPEVLVILAGRYPLKGQWLLSPAWRERTEWMPLGHLERKDVLDYARRCGVAGEAEGNWLWERTQGHGLSLALAVSAALLGGEGPLDQAGWSSELASLWLKEVPDEELRGLVEAASMLRLFNQDLLAAITGRDVGSEAFTRLTRLSFIRRSGSGWRLHDLMRDSTRTHLRERSPATFGKLMERCVLYYATLIRENYRKRDVAFEVGELFHYVGSEWIRAFMNSPTGGDYVWEPLTSANLEEGQQYLERRRAGAVPVIRRGVDPVTGELLEQYMTPEELLYMIAGLDLNELLALGQQAVMLMKDRDGGVCGLSAIIPVHSGTLGYLEGNPFSGPYLRSLSPSERKALEAPASDPAGWFIRSIDVLDWNDSALLLETASQMYRYMCAGKLFFTTPPPLAMHQQAHLGLGFEIVPGVTHCGYDGRTPTPTFVLDTRGERLEAFLSSMVSRTGLDLKGSLRQEAGREASEVGTGDMVDKRESLFRSRGLTEREREVARLVLEGCSNAEIAGRLYVSEITVKKHLSAVYAKLQVKNRSQLIKAVLE